MKTFINRKIIPLSEYSKQYYILNKERIKNKYKPKTKKPITNPKKINLAEYNRQYYLTHKEENKKKYKPPQPKTIRRTRIYYNQLIFD